VTTSDPLAVPRRKWQSPSKREQRDEYNAFVDGEDFARKLMQDVSRDKGPRRQSDACARPLDITVR
jgi:hypothetical protein